MGIDSTNIEQGKRFPAQARPKSLLCCGTVGRHVFTMMEAMGQNGDGEVLMEFHRIGSYMKAVAIDPKTGTEVSVVGPATGGQELLRRTAISKLRFVLQKNASKQGR